MYYLYRVGIRILIEGIIPTAVHRSRTSIHPLGWGRLDLHDWGHACRSWLFWRPCDPAVPALFEYRIHPRANE